VGCLRRRSLSGADQAKGVPACFVSVRAAAKQRRLRAKGGVSAFAPTGHIHGGEIVGERLGTADRWGRRDRERESGRGGGEERPHRATRERGSARARVGADRRGPPVRHRGRARGAGLSGLVWAELTFSFFLEFLLPFLFIFSRVFNSNSNQVSNSNQIKNVQQFKEYLVLI
jgi:hypothetical protein